MSHLRVLVPGSLCVVLAGCSGSYDPSTEKEPAPVASGTAATDPTKTPAKAPSGTALGASCTAYIGCCKEIAAKQPQLGASCDATSKAIDDAQKQGASTSSYESACKSGLDGFKSAGYCK